MKYRAGFGFGAVESANQSAFDGSHSARLWIIRVRHNRIIARKGPSKQPAGVPVFANRPDYLTEANGRNGGNTGSSRLQTWATA
jgi:hypothetical protein